MAKEKKNGNLLTKNKSDRKHQYPKNNLAKFSIPKYLRIMKEFPKTQTGKIQKNKLREEGVTVDTWQNYNI